MPLNCRLLELCLQTSWPRIKCNFVKYLIISLLSEFLTQTAACYIFTLSRTGAVLILTIVNRCTFFLWWPIYRKSWSLWKQLSAIERITRKQPFKFPFFIETLLRLFGLLYEVLNFRKLPRNFLSVIGLNVRFENSMVQAQTSLFELALPHLIHHLCLRRLKDLWLIIFLQIILLAKFDPH